MIGFCRGGAVYICPFIERVTEREKGKPPASLMNMGWAATEKTTKHGN